MPTQRKRIGFLPRAEVQNIIDQICKHNKISQSKITGILVEEALIYRGVLNISSSEKYNRLYRNKDKALTFNKDNVNNDINQEFNNINLDESHVKDEVKMINDFIEFKFFKNIMNQQNNSGKSVTL
tara:strand:+ start:1048 stop:1425 length:378 start_codon:yes stop_codon:yes gene_type:complete